MKPRRVASRLLTFALVFLISLLGAPTWERLQTPVQAGTKVAPKVSQDLDEFVKRFPSYTVSVIIQTPAQPSSSLTSSIKFCNGTIGRTYKNIRAAAVRLPGKGVVILSVLPEILRISFDRKTSGAGHLETTTGVAQMRNYAPGGLKGQGIGIAVLDSGVEAGHHALRNYFGQSRVIASVDFTGEGRTDDPYGHGTHVATTAAGNSHVGNGAYTGIAPDANIINVRVLGSAGQGSASNTIAGIDWCISNKLLYNIKVINLSLGTVAVESYRTDPLCLAAKRAFDAGIVVCAAAGNSGKDDIGNKLYGAIHSPGIEPSAITVGAANTHGSSGRNDDSVAKFSSRGPTRGFSVDDQGVKHYDNLVKPDLIAPGNKIIEGESQGNVIIASSPQLDATTSGLAGHRMMYMSGTSVAAPVVSGAVAILLQRNPSLTPNLVKAVLEYTAQPLSGSNSFEQGAGLLNMDGAVRLAGLVRPDIVGLTTGQPLLTGALPAQQSTIAGHTFPWGRALVQRWNVITGDNLFLKYQAIYGTGISLAEGITLAEGQLVPDGMVLTDGITLAEGCVLADGVSSASGQVILQGIALADGTLVPDGITLAEGLVLSDIYASAVSAISAQSALYGDVGTEGMPPADVDSEL
jgi:subtilisin family serine protease